MMKVIFHGVISVKDHTNYSFEKLVEQKRAEGFEPVCFCTENRFEWGKTILGLKVMNLSEAMEIYDNLPILVTSFNNYEIAISLYNLPGVYDISRERIINHDECDFISMLDYDVHLVDYDKTKPIIFYGCGFLVAAFIYILKKQGVVPRFICDTNESKHGKYVNGIYVCSLGEAATRLGDDFYIFISSSYTNQIRDYLVDELKVDSKTIINAHYHEKFCLSENLFTTV